MKLNKNRSKTLNKNWFCISVIGHINILISVKKKYISVNLCCGLIQSLVFFKFAATTAFDHVISDTHPHYRRLFKMIVWCLCILMLIITRGQMLNEVQTIMTSKHNSHYDSAQLHQVHLSFLQRSMYIRASSLCCVNMSCSVQALCCALQIVSMSLALKRSSAINQDMHTKTVHQKIEFHNECPFRSWDPLRKLHSVCKARASVFNTRCRGRHPVL